MTATFGALKAPRKLAKLSILLPNYMRARRLCKSKAGWRFVLEKCSSAGAAIFCTIVRNSGHPAQACPVVMLYDRLVDFQG